MSKNLKVSNFDTINPKYCGGDHCTGLWNIKCDAIEHPRVKPTDQKPIDPDEFYDNSNSDQLKKESREDLILKQALLDQKPIGGWHNDIDDYKQHDNIWFYPDTEGQKRKMVEYIERVEKAAYERGYKDLKQFIWDHRTAVNGETVFAKFKVKDFKL